MKSFQELYAWQIGLQLTKNIYEITQGFPSSELYGLTSQLRRSSASILANLAEGFGRFTYPDKAAKYVIARGECTEVEAFIHIALALNFISEKQATSAIRLANDTGKLLSGLISACRKRIPK